MRPEAVRMDALREMVVEVTKQPSKEPRIATFSGMKLATSTQLSHRVLALIGDPAAHAGLPTDTRDWLALQARVSTLPRPGTLLTEAFPHQGRWHLAVYGFAGRNALQTLGLLMTRLMEEAGLAPLGFLATDYALLIWSLDPVTTRPRSRAMPRHSHTASSASSANSARRPRWRITL